MPRQAIKKVRATASDVASDLKNHEVMCSERWKTCFNTLERLEAVSYTHLRAHET